MSRVKCFIDDCRFNNNMKCNAPKVSFKLRNTHPGSRAGRVTCEHYRPVP